MADEVESDLQYRADGSRVLEDPNDDLLVYDFDVDGDGVFDLEGVPTSTLELEFPDDGEVTLTSEYGIGSRPRALRLGE